MWEDYSAEYIKNNRSSSFGVIIAAFISALLLSLLCSLFYNAWKYEIERIEIEEGGWHSRFTKDLEEEELEFIENYANVKEVVVNERKADSDGTVIDIYFNDIRTVLADTLMIAESVGVLPEAIDYNYGLLAMYLVRLSQDTAPRLLFPMFIIVTILASFSLILIIHNSFAVSMNSRIHQFGIFSSIGATPKQIRICLLQEAAGLCAVPVLAGNILGVLTGIGFIQMVNVLLGDTPGRHKAVFGYHPLVLVLTLFMTVITVWISAWLPARTLSRLTPLEAIKNIGELQLNRKRRSFILSRLFGIEGELAGNALKAQRKSMRTASLSLTFSFLAVTIMHCFFILSGIGSRETYFERYQNAWDVMITVKGTDIDCFSGTEEIQEIPGVRSAVVYQKATAKRIVTEDEMSEDMKSFGGFSHALSRDVTLTEAGWMVSAPIIILDDASFWAYCEQIGITPQLDGAIIRNRIRDVTNPDFRHPQYMPYVNGEEEISTLRQSGSEEVGVEIPVLSYTEKEPVLREEYATLDYYELVHFVPVSLWKEIKENIAGCEENLYIRILAKEDAELEELLAL